MFPSEDLGLYLYPEAIAILVALDVFRHLPLAYDGANAPLDDALEHRVNHSRITCWTRHAPISLIDTICARNE